MRLILMFEESFPTTGYIDAIPFLSALEREGSCIDVLSLAKLKTVTDTLRRILHFFGSIKDGIYPQLKRLASPVHSFPEVQRRIETILDKYGDIKDSASDRLFEIRRDLRSKEAAISKRAGAILRKAQEEGLVDADADVTIRDGKYLIPVGTSAKRKVQGFVTRNPDATGDPLYPKIKSNISLSLRLTDSSWGEDRTITFGGDTTGGNTSQTDSGTVTYGNVVIDTVWAGHNTVSY
jgi:DNA mismatch repair protein MutS2